MKRFFAAFLVLAASYPTVFGQMAESSTPTPAQAPTPAPAKSPAAPAASAPAPGDASQPKVETLRDLRLAIAQGKLKGAAEMCDRLRGEYEAERSILIGSPQIPNSRSQAAVETYMACYCIYAKSQVLALTNHLPAAQAALTDARNFRTQFPEFNNPRIQPIIQQLDIISDGLIQEKSGKLDVAVQTYLPATYQAGSDEAPVATGRLAMIELKRGHTDKAQSWAYIHADEPTSQYVLAQIADQKKNPLVAQKHATTAIGLVQKQLKDGKEYMPIYFVEAPAIRALSKKLPPLPAPPKPPAPKPAVQPAAVPTPEAPKPKPQAPPAQAPGDTMAPGMAPTPKMQ